MPRRTTNRTERLRRKHVDDSLRAIASLRHLAVPAGGWLREIQSALGIPSALLAERLGVTPGAVTHLMSREVDGAVTLSSLRQAADAMDCDLVYAIIPRSGSVTDALERQAEKVARETLARVSHTMGLEDQAVARDAVEKEIEELKRELLSNPKDLWT